MRSQDHLKAVLAFQEKYPEKEEREKALRKMFRRSSGTYDDAAR